MKKLKTKVSNIDKLLSQGAVPQKMVVKMKPKAKIEDEAEDVHNAKEEKEEEKPKKIKKSALPKLHVREWNHKRQRG